jgi:hypothetical protein
VKRGLLGLLVLGAGVVVFHRPLAHWAIRHFGGRAAERAGLRASWTSSGSVLGDLAFEGVRVTGGEGSVVRSLTAERAAVEYDLWQLRGGGLGTVVEKVVIRRVEADIDLTRRAAEPDGGAKKQSARAMTLPAVRTPVIDIEHVSLRLRLPGGLVEVVDFSLALDPARPGRISVARVAAPGVPELHNVAGDTTATAQSLVIENLSLWPEVMLERLAIDLADLAAGRMGVHARARQAAATAEVTGDVVLGGEAGPGVEASATARQVSSGTLAYWGVPDGGVDWNAGEVAVQARGPVLRPDLLAVTVTLQGGSLQRDGLPAATVAATAEIQAGAGVLKELRVQAGQGTATARATAALPQTWKAVADAAGQAAVEFDLPALEEWVPSQAAVRGRAGGRAEAGFAGRALSGASAAVEGAGLVIQGLPVETLTTRVTTTDGGRLQLAAEARLNASNVAETSGWLDLRGERAFEVTWKADCRDLATVPVEARAGWPWPTAGTLASSGTASGSLAAVGARDWARLSGMAEAEAASLKIRDASLGSLRLRARAQDGEVGVEDLSVRLDAENTLTCTGRLSLLGEQAPVSGRLRASLPSVARVSAWSTSFGGPALQGGSVVMDWEGRGEAGISSLEGSGSALVQGLRLDGVAQPLGLEAAVTHAGKTASLNKLSATAGPWRAEGSAVWDGARLEVPALTAWVKDQRLGRAQGLVPLGGPRAPDVAGPIDPDAPLVLKLNVEALDLDRLGADLGRALPVRGLVKAEADFTGTLRSLSGALRAEASGLRPAGKPVEKLDPAEATLKAVLRDGRLSVEVRAQQKPLEPLTLEARAPVDVAAVVRNPSSAKAIPLNGRVRLAESSLSFVPGWVPALQSVRGTAGIDAEISGTVGTPKWKGVATVVIPEARLTGASLPSIKEVVLRIRADEKRLTIEEAGVLLAGGRLRVQGGADLTRLQDPVLDLSLRAEEVLVVRDENLSLRANTDITCRGPFSRAAVSGAIDLVRGRVFKEIEFLPLSLPNQLPPPPPPTTLGRTSPPALPPPFDAWTIDLTIRTRDPIRLMGNVARGNVAADLRLTGTGARPVLTGRADLQQMWVKLPFSRLDITEGAVVFTEDKPFDPQINVQGESIIDGRMVEVAVQGRALDPRVRLTSSPPLPEGDIAALLATGVTTSDLATRGDEAAGRAAYVMLQQAYRKMFRKTARSRDDAEPPRLSFEFALFGSDPSRRSLSAVYELNPKWRVIGRVGEAGTFRGLLHYLIRFR